MLVIFAPTLVKVMDVSRGGLRLKYITSSCQERQWSQVNLYLTSSKAYLPALPFRLVYDRQLDGNRVCGLKFLDLSEPTADRLQLESFPAPALSRPTTFNGFTST